MYKGSPLKVESGLEDTDNVILSKSQGLQVFADTGAAIGSQFPVLTP
ncbi:hypothetical protein [Paenibacillus sp. Leaf72]|nr:hypothetical protein [Paenibacillus sp. Leaf72]